MNFDDKKQSAFHDISVTTENGERVLRFGGIKQSAVSDDGCFESSQDYHRLAHLGIALVPNVRRILLIGLGGGALAGKILSDYPDFELVVCEIDPVVVHLATTEFGLPASNNLTVVIEDGRRYVEQTDETFDFIFVDAYFTQGMPYALVTKEAFCAYSSRLSEQGVLGFNFVDRPNGEGIGRLIASSKPYFTETFSYATGNACGDGRTNVAIFFTKSLVEAEWLEERIKSKAEGTIKITGFDGFAEYNIAMEADAKAATFQDSDSNDGFVQT